MGQHYNNICFPDPNFIMEWSTLPDNEEGDYYVSLWAIIKHPNENGCWQGWRSFELNRPDLILNDKIYRPRSRVVYKCIRAIAKPGGTKFIKDNTVYARRTIIERIIWMIHKSRNKKDKELSWTRPPPTTAGHCQSTYTSYEQHLHIL